MQKEIKTQEKIQNEQSKELMKINEESDFYTKIKNLGEELRMQKVRNKEWQEKANKEREKNQKYKDRIRELELKLKQSKQPKSREKQLEQSKDEESPSSEEVESLRRINQKLKVKWESLNKRLKGNKIIHAKEAKELRYELENMQVMFRDKDKEARLLSLKLKELYRIGKFQKLKPLDFELETIVPTSTRAKSTLRNNYNSF